MQERAIIIFVKRTLFHHPSIRFGHHEIFCETNKPTWGELCYTIKQEQKNDNSPFILRNGKKKRTGLIITGMLSVLLFLYCFTACTSNKEMTGRQQILRSFYPLLMKAGKTTVLRNDSVQPPVSFYTLSVTLMNGDTLDFNTLKGKNVMLVNTASDCGYTRQYEGLQRLQERYPERLVVIAFPSNDFKNQESATNEEIAGFCRINYGVRFPLARKSSVKPGKQQHPVFQWLSDKNLNGWNNQDPQWNFSKYIVDEKGMLIGYCSSAVDPLSADCTAMIER